MIFLNVAISLFIILESLNVIALYFKPTLKQANTVGVFKAWDKSKKDMEMYRFVRYMTFWVAGTKLMFIALLIAILIWGDMTMKVAGGIALTVSIVSYYWKLHPLISIMDKKGELEPKGYSKTLGVTILTFIIVLTVAIVVALVV